MYILKKFKRWISFHFLVKRKYKNIPGIPVLCSNINHPFHESKFEAKCCETLHFFFHEKDILTPSQHRCKTKFDFIIKKIAIIEPHGIWGGKPNENMYFDYYRNRKELAEKEQMTKDLPVLVLASYSDLTKMKKYLVKGNNPKKAISELIIELLQKYNTVSPSEVIIQQKRNKKLLIFGILGWIVSFGLLLIILLHF